jgi:hypothetical protein
VEAGTYVPVVTSFRPGSQLRAAVAFSHFENRWRHFLSFLLWAQSSFALSEKNAEPGR